MSEKSQIFKKGGKIRQTFAIISNFAILRYFLLELNFFWTKSEFCRSVHDHFRVFQVQV